MVPKIPVIGRKNNLFCAKVRDWNVIWKKFVELSKYNAVFIMFYAEYQQMGSNISIVIRIAEKQKKRLSEKKQR